MRVCILGDCVIPEGDINEVAGGSNERRIGLVEFHAGVLPTLCLHPRSAHSHNIQ